MKNLFLAAAMFAVFALASCSAEVVATQPGDVEVGVVGVAPGPDYIWVGPEWVWQGGNYVRVAGHWARPPHEGGRWYAGHWDRKGRGYHWSRGHWG